MKTLLLLSGAVLGPVTACEKSDVSHLGRAQAHIIAAMQADKSPAKPTPPAQPPSPAKKPAPKEREPRPAPPAHLFM